MSNPSHLAPDNPLLTERPDFWDCAQGMCLHPRVTIRRIVDYDPLYGQVILMGALTLSLAALDLKNGLLAFLGSALLNGSVYVLSLYSTALLFWVSGKPLQGKARLTEMCAAVVWSMTPALLGNVLTFATLPVLGDAWGIAIGLIAYLYAFQLMLATVAEVQRFTLVQSFLNQLLAMILGLALLAIPTIIFWSVIITLVLKVAHSMNFTTTGLF
jgi:hypothetical protein